MLYFNNLLTFTGNNMASPHDKKSKLRSSIELARKCDALEKEYRIFFESSRDAIMLLDRSGFFDCNTATLELFGMKSKETFIQKHPIDLSPFKQSDGRESTVAARDYIEQAYNKGTVFFEWIHKRMDGTPFYAEVLLSRVDYQGRKILQANVRDITERKQTEEEIRHIGTIHNLIMENSTLGISLVRHRVFEWANARVGELLKLPLAKIQGASTRIIYPSQESYEKLGRIAYPVLTSGQRSDTTLQLKRSDGSLFWCRFIGKALDPNNVHEGSIWMFEDITEKKKAQEIAEKNAEQKGRIEMANNVLHDIGNAMTGISAQILRPEMNQKWREIQLLYQLNDLFYNDRDELEEILGTEKQKALSSFMEALVSSFEKRYSSHLKFLDKISAAVKHVCSVLDLQRQYLGEKSSPLKKDINLVRMINDTLVMMSDSLKKRNIHVSMDKGGGNLNIAGDQTGLMRVFLNLIKNICEAFDAQEYTTNRTLKVKLSLVRAPKAIKITFTDNAIGFNPKYSEKLFERGYTSKTNGSGIGLHECRDIVESHGGQMKIESKGENKGSTTIIEFPL